MDFKTLELFLNKIVNNTIVTDNGQVLEIKQLVDKIRNLKIHIYSNEHNPPHFHVISKCETINAVFDLQTGSLIKGHIDGKDEKRIGYYYSQFKDKLIEYWENNNPDKKIN